MIQTRLRDFFEGIFVLNVDKREEKVSRQLQPSDNPTILRVGDGKKCGNYFHIDENPPETWTGTRQSWNYYQCWFKLIQKVQDRRLANFLFLEDDAWFQPEFDETFGHTISQIREKSIAPDMLYLGANHWSSKTRLVAPNLLRISCSLDMHAVAVGRNLFQPILDLQEKEWLHQNPYLDGTIAYQFHEKFECYAVYPSVVWQFDGWSENEQRFISRADHWKHPGLMEIAYE